LSVDRFVLFFGVIAGFSIWISGLTNNWALVHRCSLIICDFRDYLEMPGRFNRGKGIPLPAETSEIRFNNVSFGYTPDERIIEKLNLTIKKGEKIAIVGKNGAGKTTLVKLLCGFYMPDEGEIFLDGKNIKEYNLDEYYTLFSAVFQDINFIPDSIRNNIIASDSENYDSERLNEVVELAGLKEKFDSLPDGLSSIMGKSIYDDAIELSGGQMQKLALARALYKNGKILVLDEPTAALDPIAESVMYEQYKEMAKERTSIFISHRLASTRFCDRIILLDNGKILECGTHDELLSAGGTYAEMFNIQSQYYKNNQEPAEEILA